MRTAIVLGTAIAAGSAAFFLGDTARWALTLCFLGAIYADVIWRTMS